VSIGLPQTNPVNFTTEQELTISARDVKVLGSAMVKLSDLGLPFKRRVDNWYEMKPKQTKPVQHASNRVVDAGRARAESLKKKDSPDTDLAVAISGFHITSPTQKRPHRNSNPNPNPNPWLTQEYDVFVGNRKRAQSDLPVSSGQDQQFTNNDAEGDGIARGLMLSHVLQSGLNIQPSVVDTQASGSDNMCGALDNLFGPHRVSSADSGSNRSFSEEYPVLARYLAKIERLEKKAHTEENSAEALKVGGTLVDHVDPSASDANNQLQVPQQHYQIPQRRNSVPKLQIDTSVGHKAPVQESRSAPTEDTSTRFGFENIGSYVPPTTTPTGHPWGPYTGENEDTKLYGDLSEEAISRAFEPAGGYTSIPSSITIAPAVPRIPPHLWGLPTAEEYVKETTTLPPRAASPYQQPEPTSPIRQQQPSYRYYKTHKAAPMYMQENVKLDYNPHNNNRPNAYHPIQQQSPSRFPRPGYQGFARPVQTRLQQEGTSVYTAQQQGGASQDHWVGYGGDQPLGMGVYTLRPIPITGPRYIR
jgi:hypothetical protein